MEGAVHASGGVVLEGGVGRLKQVWERWVVGEVREGQHWGRPGSFWSFSPGAGKIIGGGFERSDG